MSPRSSIGRVQNDFRSCGTFRLNLAPILHQDYDYLKMDPNKLPLEPRHLVIPSGASKMISEPMVRSVQTVHLSCVKISTISKRTENELPPVPRHLGVASDASKMIYVPMVH